MNYFTESYLECAMWSSSDGEVETLDNLDMDSDTMDNLILKAEKFWNENEKLIHAFMEAEGVDEGQVGHSLWLSQNGHGAGFFDFGVIGDQLHEIARNNPTNLYIGDDGKVHC